MKMSSKARRLRRHYGRMHKSAGLNLVSLMDIFTILVFFLMVNSSDVQVLQPAASVKLPESTAEQNPEETLTVMITSKDVLVAGRTVATFAELEQSTAETLSGLKSELDYQATRTQQPLPADTTPSRPITIVADRELPYQLLKKVMATCVASGYSRISLAVTHKSESEV